MVRIAEAIARRNGALALVTRREPRAGGLADADEHRAHRRGRAACPILRPLIGMDKLEITDAGQAARHLRDLDRARRRLLHALHPAAPVHAASRPDEVSARRVPPRHGAAGCAGRARARRWRRSSSRRRRCPGPTPARGVSPAPACSCLDLDGHNRYGQHMLRRWPTSIPRSPRPPRGDPAPAPQSRADRLGELRLRRRAGGGGLRPHQQVRRGLPGPALLRRVRGRGRRRGSRHRPGQGAVRRRARQRPAALRRPGQHGGVLHAAQARRRGARAQPLATAGTSPRAAP